MGDSRQWAADREEDLRCLSKDIQTQEAANELFQLFVEADNKIRNMRLTEKERRKAQKVLEAYTDTLSCVLNQNVSAYDLNKLVDEKYI